MAKKLSEAQIWLVDYLGERHGKQQVQPEFEFCDRKWRFDVAIRDFRWGFEVEGGLFMAGTGRHNRGAGMRADMEKYNTATALGWKVFRFTPEQILKGEAKAFIERYL
jgi:hypothetical protein